MIYYDEARPLFLKHISSVGLGSGVMQVRDSIRDEITDNMILRLTACVRNSLSSAERRYRNMEREAVGIWHGIEIISTITVLQER